MEKLSRFQFISGFILGAVLFGSVTAFAATVIATSSTNKILVNGQEVNVEAYMIEGRNYLQLNDIAKAIDFSLEWDGANNKVLIDTAKGYAKNETPVQPTPSPIPEPNETPKPSTVDEPFAYNVGDTPGNILVNSNDTTLKGHKKYNEAYKYGVYGQCAWYAQSRFAEVHGIDVNVRDLGSVIDWLEGADKYDDLKVIKDISAIQSLTIAVYQPKQVKQGHTVFIEYVERDSDGNPINIYFTEANGVNTLNYDQFDLGYDGAIQKLSFDKFKDKSTLTLIGYIALNN